MLYFQPRFTNHDSRVTNHDSRLTNNESGRTMVETLAVLSVITVLLLGVVSGLGFMFTSWRIYTVHSEVEDIAQGVLDLTSWDRDFRKATMALICANDILPRACQDNKWSNPWGGEMTVVPSDGNASFEIRITQLPQDVCSQLKARTWRLVNAPSGDCSASLNTLAFTPAGI